MPGIFFPQEFTSPRPLFQRGNQILEGVTAVATEFGRVLKWTEDGFRHSDPIDGMVSGLCVSVKAEAGEKISLLTHGLAESKDWTAVTGSKLLTPDAYYYLVADVMLSIMASSEGYILRVGRAVSPTVLHVTFDLKVA